MFGENSPSVKNLLSKPNDWLKIQTLTYRAIGSTITTGHLLRNATDATTTATVQASPATVWEGRGLSTTGNTSATVAFRSYALPVQNSTAYGAWKLQYSLNNGAYENALTWQGNSTSGKKFFTVNGYTVLQSDNSSTVDTLLSLNVTSSGSKNHVGLTFGSTIRSSWSVDTSGTTELKTAGSSPTHTFFVGSTITSQTQIAQIYTNGFYNSYSNYNGGVVTAGSADTSVQTSLSTYGSFAVKGKLVTDSSYTLASTETFVYVDPSNANVCAGTPTACNTYMTEGNCNAHSGVGCSWFAGNSCSPGSNTDSSTCTSQGAGCVWDEVSCSPGNNTDQTTCEDQDNAYGGSCSWNTSTCPSQMTEGECQAITGCTWSTTCSASPDQSTCEANSCTWNFSDCSTFNGGTEAACEANSGCTWTGADCHTFDGTDQATCETGHTGCTWNAGSCDGVYDEASTCAGQYDTSCTGDTCSGNICDGNFFNGNCSGTYGGGCQGSANCNNLTDDGSVACAAESGCTWTVGITLTLPTTANASRGTTGRVYSIMHVGNTGSVIIQGQSGEPIFQYTTLPLFKKGDKVLLHNQNITFQCNLFTSITPCNAQTGCTWLVACSTLGDQSSCEAVSGCSWNGDSSVCEGPAARCNGTYDNGSRWYAHSLERGLNYVEKTANYTIASIDDVINCTSNSFTLTLPSAALNNGKVFILKNTGTGLITIATTSSQTIDGAASGTLTLIQNDSITVQSNNSNWIRI